MKPTSDETFLINVFFIYFSLVFWVLSLWKFVIFLSGINLFMNANVGWFAFTICNGYRVFFFPSFVCLFVCFAFKKFLLSKILFSFFSFQQHCFLYQLLRLLISLFELFSFYCFFRFLWFYSFFSWFSQFYNLLSLYYFCSIYQLCFSNKWF